MLPVITQIFIIPKTIIKYASTCIFNFHIKIYSIKWLIYLKNIGQILSEIKSVKNGNKKYKYLTQLIFYTESGHAILIFVPFSSLYALGIYI